MKETAINKIPYAEDSDAPDYPTQGKALAELLDTLKWGSRNLKPTVGVVQASEDLSLTTSYQDVAGTTKEITPAVAGILRVTAIFDLRIVSGESTTADDEAFGTLRVDAEDQAPAATLILDNTTLDVATRATVAQVYSISLSAAAHTMKLRAKRGSAASSTGTCFAAGTRWLYELVAS